MSDDEKTSFLRKIWLRFLAAIGVIAAIMLSWWWKIEEIRTPDNTPIVTMGQTVDLGRSKLTPVSLALTRGPDQTKQLVLSAKIENITSKTQAAVFGLPVKLAEIQINGSKLAAPEIILTRDNDLLPNLQPRMVEDVTLTWPMPADWQIQPVNILFSKEKFKLKDSLYGESNWLGNSPEAQMIVLPEVKL